VVGHRDVADHNKLVALTDFFEDFEEQVAPLWACQPRLAMIRTTGEEVEIIMAGVALKTGGHVPNFMKADIDGWRDQKQNPTAFAFGNPTLAQNARAGHPRVLSAPLSHLRRPSAAPDRDA
jgi:hypothetical protein